MSEKKSLRAGKKSVIDYFSTIADNEEMKEALVHYRHSFGIKRDDPRGHNRLGIILTKQGKLSEATIAFLRAIQLSPGYADAYSNLGNALVARDEPEKALAAFEEARQLNPDNETSRHMADALAGRQPSAPPPKYVRKLFDQYAPFFDRHLKALSYQAAEKLKKTLENCSSADHRFASAIDLGCGTGLSGLTFACLTEYLDGVDISGEMLKKAAERQIYDELVSGDICEVLRDKEEEAYDLFIAVDVLSYLGRFDDLFSIVRDKARDGALFIFTTESGREHDYFLQENGRYAHSPSYIAGLCRRSRFFISRREEIEIRKNKGCWVRGDAYILKYAP